MRTSTFQLETDIPRGKESYAAVRDLLAAIKPQLGREWGQYGKDFGLGFTWATKRRVTNTRLVAIKRYLLRAMIENGLMRPMAKANVYNLEQRITHSYGTTPKATVTLKEGD